MIIEMKVWVREKGTKYRNILDNDPKYNLWDVPFDLTKTWSEHTLSLVQEEVFLLDLESSYGVDERKKLELSLKKEKRDNSNFATKIYNF
jgi:hypothetical protein